MNRLAEWIEGLPARAFGLGSVAAIGLPLAGLPIATGALDVVLVGLAVAGGGGAGWAALHRRRVANLPPEFAETALAGRLDGCDVYRFRVRLGHGRRMGSVRVEVAFEPEGGDPVALRPVMPQGTAVLGPFTIAALDPSGVARREGAFVVRVRAREGDRQWQVEERWRRAELGRGRFAPGVVRRRGRLAWDRAGWDAVQGGDEEPA